MNKWNTYISILILLLIVGCSKNSIKTISIPEGTKGYDTTQYNLLFADALKQKMLGNASDALRYFEQSIRLNPQSDAAYYQISQIAAAKGDFARAKQYGRHAYEIDTENSWYISNIAALYYNENNLDSVSWYYQKLLEIEPEREDIMFGLGSIYMESGKYDKAETIFEKFAKKYPDNDQLLMSLVNVYRSQNKNTEAEEMLLKLVVSDPGNNNYRGLLAEFYRSVGEKDKALELYRDLFDRDPTNGLLQLSYIDFILQEKKYSELTEFLSTVLINENIAIEDKLNLFGQLLNDTLLLRKNGSELLISALILHAENKENPSVNLLLSEYYEKLNNRPKAIEVLEGFIEKDESNYFVWEKLLFYYNENQEINKLFGSAKRASTLFNRIPVPKLLYAFAATDKGEYELALAELQKTRILVNEQKEFMVQILSLEADIFYRQKQYSKAFEKFDEALALNENDTYLLNNFSYFMAEQDYDLPKSLRLIERCLEIESNPTYLDTYAWVLYKLGKYRKAEGVMIMLESNGLLNDADLYEHYGFIRKARNDSDGAVKMWSEAIRLDTSKDYLLKEIEECTK